jgi:hypothetical protein
MTDTRWEPGPGARYVTAGGEIVNRLGIPDPEPASVPVLGPPPLSFHSLGELLDAQAMAPPPTYLAEGIWPGDAYGVLGAVMKAGKTWLVLDLAVSVAMTGGSWLGQFKIERSGPVVLFLGEGGARKMTRRLTAVSAFYGVDPRTLPIEICLRAPHLTNAEHLKMIGDKLDQFRPVLVVVDPLYLSARGAQGSQLYEMGAVLEGVQLLCQRVGAALLVSHHLNRQEGRGPGRLSGAGPAEWGRVLITADVKASHTDPDSQESAVTLELDIVGDEIAEQTLRIRRRVEALDPADLGSPLVYSVDVLEGDAAAVRDDDGLRPSHRRVLEVLTAAGDDEWLDKRDIGDRLATDNTGLSPLKARTIQDATRSLGECGLIETRGIGTGSAFQWRVMRTGPIEDGGNDA